MRVTVKYTSEWENTQLTFKSHSFLVAWLSSPQFVEAIRTRHAILSITVSN